MIQHKKGIKLWLSFRHLSGHLISKWYVFLISYGTLVSVSVPSRGILFPNSLGEYYCELISVSVPSRGILFTYGGTSDRNYYFGWRFRPLSGHIISKYCPPEPAILLAFLTLLRGKSFSCIFFLYLTYTIASKCSIYAVRGKIINYTNTIWTAILLFRINLFFFYFLKYSHS